MARLPGAPQARPPLVAAALVSTATLLFLGTGLHPVWWLTWLAPLPLLLVAPRVTRRRALWLAALAWFLGSANMWRYLLTALGLPLPAVVVVSVVPGLFFGLCVLLFRGLVLRGEPGKAALSFPLLWVAIEFLNAITSRHGTFPNVGYTQVELLPLLQLAAVTGVWGLGFSLFLVPATLAALLSASGTARARRRLAAAVATFLAVVLAHGGWRLAATPAPDRTVRIGLAATGAGTSFPREDAGALRLLREYAERTAGLVAQGAEVVVLPEKIALVSDEAAREADALWAATSASTGASVVVGVDRRAGDRRSNEARLYGREGPLGPVYVKHHLVPAWEDAHEPGEEIVAISRPSGIWGLQICKDMDFPALSRRYAAAGAGLMLVPAWDFTLDGRLHARMAVVRGVESGFTVARAAKQGLLTVSDGRGRILAEEDAATPRVASLVVTAPVRHEETVYARRGDWFAWLDVAALAAVLFSVGRAAWRERGTRKADGGAGVALRLRADASASALRSG